MQKTDKHNNEWATYSPAPEPVGEGEQEYAIGEGTYRFVVIDSNEEDLENVSGVAWRTYHHQERLCRDNRDYR